MKKFEKNIGDRKVLVARISELTGETARYTRVPRCAYEIGSFAVEKDGRLTVEEGADESVLQTLIAENLIGECIEETHPVSISQEEPLASVTAQIIRPTETDSGETVEPDPVPDAEYEQEAEEESAASLGVRDAEENAFPMNTTISFPLDKHTASSLTNLICMIHTRGPLLSKATQGNFHVDKELVDEILDHHTFRTAAELISFVKEWDETGEAVRGISFDEEKVNFDGFTDAEDAEHSQTFMKLAAAMNKMAQTQKRVQAKETDDSNEKYALRVWLVRLGLNGPEFKTERKILMEHLSGHAAFRTKTDEEKWKARQQSKRQALKAAKEEAYEAE